MLSVLFNVQITLYSLVVLGLPVYSNVMRPCEEKDEADWILVYIVVCNEQCKVLVWCHLFSVFFGVQCLLTTLVYL